MGWEQITPRCAGINLATNDYVGHEFGPQSPELLDVTVETDRQLQEGRIGNAEIESHLSKAFYPKIAGDFLIVAEQGCFTEASPYIHTTTHGSLYAYDTHVPLLLAGFGIQGTYYDSVSSADLAPSLSALLGVALPSACDGHPLVPALRKP